VNTHDELAARRRASRPSAADTQPAGVEPLDYCQCNRGPVIGIVTYTDTRLQFFSLEDWHARTHHDAANLRCIDCLADAAMDVANGVVRERMQEMARKRGAEMNAMMQRNEMRREAGLPVATWIDGDGNERFAGGER
jgi:hypothetical protein